MSQETTTGRKSIPEDLLKARRDTTIKLKLMCLSNESVKNRLNDMSKVRGWGEVTLRTIERDISTYYREYKPNQLEDIEYTLSLREITASQIEQTIEQMFDLISEKNIKNDWVLGEKEKALKVLLGMIMDYAEFQGWNFGKPNFGKIFAIADMAKKKESLAIWDRANYDLEQMSPATTDALGNAITRLFNEELKKKESLSDDKEDA